MPDTEASHADALLSAIAVLRRQIRREAGRPWLDPSLSEAQTELLRLVRRRPGVSVAAAADELGLAANTVSTLVCGLRGRGLLVRDHDPGDRRVARLELSPDTTARVASWRDRRVALVAGAIGALDPADAAILAAAPEALRRLAERIAVDHDRATVDV